MQDFCFNLQAIKQTQQPFGRNQQHSDTRVDTYGIRSAVKGSIQFSYNGNNIIICL